MAARRRRRLDPGAAPQPPPSPNPPEAANNAENAGLERYSVLQALKQIQNGTLRPASLDRASRRACVEHLSGEGYSLAEIAEVLGVSSRTIARDRRTIQQEHAIERDPRLGGELAGQLIQEAQRCITRMRRAARDRQATPAVRVEAERGCFSVLNDMVQRLQSLGFAPHAAQKFEAELTHRGGDPPSLEQIEDEIQRLGRLAAGDPENVLRLADLRELASRARLSRRVAEVRAEHTQENGEGADGPSA